MSRLVQHRPRVAFQGERGAFSEEAILALLGSNVRLVPCPALEDLFRTVGEGTADYALAPIENTLAGSIHRSYDLLLESSLDIAGESIVPVTHNLIGCPGASFDSVRSVESHPVALAQCERFFAAHPEIERVAADDTAASVRRVVERGDPTRAAIASARAADLYGGSILREHLEDHPENYTRFFLLSAAREVSKDADKLSLVLRLGHQPGALHRALGPFAERGIDLLKIESRPVKGRPWQYYFYLDLQGSINDGEVAAAISELCERTAEVRVLGCYPSAQTLSSVTSSIRSHQS